MAERKRLPIGIQNLREIREENHYYVDKTVHIRQLLENGKHYFLSRPRRFGKSLLLDTLKELFEGHEALFQGLAIHQHWDWSVQYPVLRLSFGRKNYRDPDALQESLHQQLSRLEEHFQLGSRFADAGGRFADLLERIRIQGGRPVVVLIDEYDKPILDALESPAVAEANRDFLRGFYATIKDFDAHIRFSFLTGVSKFSKVSLFSGLNNLKDITLDPRYSTICGYTDHDLDTVFAPELPGLDREEIRAWYNGYHWLGEGVYNPFDILQLFDERRFKSYWFETGTPTFLVEQLLRRQVPSVQLDKLISSSDMLSSFEIKDISIEALLFQTGYLTIRQEENLGGQFFYTLGYPNREVYQSLNSSLLGALVQNRSQQSVNTSQLYRLLNANDFAGLEQLFHSFFASIPHQWYHNNTIQNYEGYYASVFYSYFASLGLDIVLEDTSNLGRIDMTLKFNGQIYIFEFKVVELSPAGQALQQIRDRAYADKYRALNRPVYLIGVEFS
ncbi:MAG: ATP-binding protein, partial [Thiothrix sp.]|nr:ATP-binding protein [Thiothrix sp.]